MSASGKALTGGFGDFAATLRRHSELLRELVRRDIQEAYAGAMFSRFWSAAHPLLQVGLYLFVFGHVFAMRLGADMPKSPDFAVYMLSGLACWLTVQASLSKATSSLIASANLVKQVVFPIELLPVRAVIAAHLPLLAGIIGVTLYSALFFGMVSPLLPLVPVVVALQAAMLIGLGLFLAALAVFVRDVRDIVQFFSSFGVFLLPVLYLPGMLPDWFKSLLWFNPFSYAVWCMQDIFFFQSFAHPAAWLVLPVFSVLSLKLGLSFFERTRANFGDVL